MYYLGVDGGGTKTSFLLCDSFGNKIAKYTTSTCHYFTIGADGITKIMHEGAKALLNNINKNEVIACVGTTGYGDIKKYDLIIEAAVNAGLLVTTIVCSDTKNALAGALALKDGINIIAGTGSVVLGLKNGKYSKSGGWHHLFLGDEGSAYWLACALIREFTYQSDGRHEKTLLYSYLYDFYHMNNDDDILKLVIDDYKEDRTKIALMAKHLYILAKAGDKASIEIYHKAVNEYVCMITSVKEKLEFDTVSCSYTGGVFNSVSIFEKELKEKLANNSIILAKPILGPLEGSVLLAMQGHTKITKETIVNLQKEL